MPTDPHASKCGHGGESMPRRPPRGFSSWVAYRDALAQRKGWSSYAQQRWWTPRLATPDVVAALARRCCAGRGHERARAGSIFCGHCNDVINPRHTPRPSTWQIRLVRHVLAQEARDRQGRYVRASVRKGRRTRLRNAGVDIDAMAARLD